MPAATLGTMMPVWMSLLSTQMVTPVLGGVQLRLTGIAPPIAPATR
jgi:hypothetical protein